MKSLSISVVRRFLYFHKFGPIHQSHISGAAASTASSSLVSRTYRSFPENPCRNMSTGVEQSSGRNKKKVNLEEAFESATTTEEMVRLFKEMELSLEGNELGFAALKLGLHLHRKGKDNEKVLSFAEKAVRIFDLAGDEPTLRVAMALQLMGSANYGLNRFSDSLGCLNRANQLLVKLEAEGDNAVEYVWPVLHAVQLELANVKNAMGRREEAIANLKKSLEIAETAFEEGSKLMGLANRSLADACVAVLNFSEALRYALKALEIHEKELGDNSAEVALDRRLLGVIYSGLEEHDKALEQNRMSRKILQTLGMESDLTRAEIDAANMKVALGKHEEAVDLLKSAVQHTHKDSVMRALLFMSISNAMVNQQEFADSKRSLDFACEILGKHETASPLQVSEAYSQAAMQYESMNEFQTALSLLQKMLAMVQKHPKGQRQHSEGSVSARIGGLLLFLGRVSQAVPYLESAAESLKDSFGAYHFGVGYAYKDLGSAYFHIGDYKSAIQALLFAKDIMDVSLGPNHVDSINACQMLSKAYAGMKKFGLAVTFQLQVIDAWENRGDVGREEMKEARRLLEVFRLKV